MDAAWVRQANRSYIRLDPRTKLLVLFAGSITAVSVLPRSAEIMLFIFLTVLLLNGRQTRTAVKMPALFISLLLLDLLVAPLLSGAAGVAFLSVTRVVRIYLPICLSFILVVKTTTVSEFIAALHKMHVSDKITIPLSVMFRFIPTVKEEWQAIRSAMKFRGMGNGNATDGQVAAAAKAAQCHEFIMKLPHGYDTVLDADGAHLSGGEKVFSGPLSISSTISI